MPTDSRRRRVSSAKSFALNHIEQASKQASKQGKNRTNSLGNSQYAPTRRHVLTPLEPALYVVHLKGIPHELSPFAFASLAAEVIGILQVHVGAPDAPPTAMVDGIPVAVAHAVHVLTRNLRGHPGRMAKARPRQAAAVLEPILTRLAGVRTARTALAQGLTLVKSERR